VVYCRETVSFCVADVETCSASEPAVLWKQTHLTDIYELILRAKVRLSHDFCQLLDRHVLGVRSFAVELYDMPAVLLSVRHEVRGVRCGSGPS